MDVIFVVEKVITVKMYLHDPAKNSGLTVTKIIFIAALTGIIIQGQLPRDEISTHHKQALINIIIIVLGLCS